MSRFTPPTGDIPEVVAIAVIVLSIALAVSCALIGYSLWAVYTPRRFQ